LARPDVTDLLIALFETATVTLQAVYAPPSDIGAITAVYGALDIAHRSTAWAAALEPSVFYQLVLGIRAARRVSLKTRGVDEAEPGSWAARLGAAVDGFDEALYKRGWSGSKELRALEGECSDGDEERIHLARSKVAAAREEKLCDEMEGMRLGGRGGEEEEEEDVEIITEREGGEAGDVEMADEDHEEEAEAGKEEASIEPYLGGEDGY
jgi:hypothetical protein